MLLNYRSPCCEQLDRNCMVWCAFVTGIRRQSADISNHNLSLVGSLLLQPNKWHINSSPSSLCSRSVRWLGEGLNVLLPRVSLIGYVVFCGYALSLCPGPLSFPDFFSHVCDLCFFCYPGVCFSISF